MVGIYWCRPQTRSCFVVPNCPAIKSYYWWPGQRGQTTKSEYSSRALQRVRQTVALVAALLWPSNEGPLTPTFRVGLHVITTMLH